MKSVSDTKELNDIVIVTGVSASGKDFLLSRSLQKLEAEHRQKQISYFSFGCELHKAISSAYKSSEITRTRDSLRHLPAAEVRQFGRRVLTNIVAIPGTKIINTHVTYREGDLVVTDPLTDLEVAPRDYIFIQSHPADILRRRHSDTSRQRAHEDMRLITIHQDIALGAVTSLCRVLGAGLTILNNNHDNVQQNVERITAAITRV